MFGIEFEEDHKEAKQNSSQNRVDREPKTGPDARQSYFSEDLANLTSDFGKVVNMKVVALCLSFHMQLESTQSELK